MVCAWVNMLSNLFSTAEAKENRFWEIDFLRGAAIIMMVVSNFITDLDYFNFYKINTLSGTWWFLARTTAAIFVFLVGVSLTISYSRATSSKPQATSPIALKYIKRGLKIFSWGLIITFVSWLFIKEDFIIFGVLHLIGLSIILAYPLLKFRFANLLLGSIFFALGFYIKNIFVSAPYFLWLGIPPTNYYSVDYLPLIPWFGAVLFGLFIGNTLYPSGIRNFKVPALENFLSIKFVSFLGKNSLLIYLIHQPILILALKILSG